MTKLSIFSCGMTLLLAACSSSNSGNPGGTGGKPPTSGGGSSSTAGGPPGTAGATGGSGGTAVAGSGQVAGSAGLAAGGAGGGSGGAAGTASGGSGTAGSSSGGMAGASSGGSAGSAGSSTAVTVQLGSARQPIDGFGLNTALSSPSVPWDMFYTATGNGIGLSLVRGAMDSQGKLNGVVPPASYNAKVIGSAWTAPANCKDNNSTTKGGHLLTSCYESWATTIANFAKTQNLYA